MSLRMREFLVHRIVLCELRYPLERLCAEASVFVLNFWRRPPLQCNSDDCECVTMAMMISIMPKINSAASTEGANFAQSISSKSS